MSGRFLVGESYNKAIEERQVAEGLARAMQVAGVTAGVAGRALVTLIRTMSKIEQTKAALREVFPDD